LTRVQANNYHVKVANGAEGVRIFVVVGRVALEVRVLLVEHFLRGCQAQLNTYPTL
jgi:hypothetical protein